MIITTAATNRQVETIIWGQHIRAPYREAQEMLEYVEDAWRKIEPRLPKHPPPLTQKWEWTSDWRMLGFKTKEYAPARMSGYHSKYVFVLVSEASDIQDDAFWHALDGLMSSGHTRLLEIGNPWDMACQFVQHGQDPRYHSITMSNWISPNVLTAKWARGGKVLTEQELRAGLDPDEIAKPGYNLKGYEGMCAWDWPWKQLQQYGPDDPFYQIQVKGQPAESGADKPITVAMIRSAKEILFDQRMMDEETQLCVLAIDPADSGLDKTGYCYRIGPEVQDIWARSGDDTGQTAQKIRHGIVVQKMKVDVIVIDSDGVGVGVYNRLQEFKDAGDLPEELKLIKIHSSGKPYTGQGAEQYFDRRTEMWGETAKQMRKGEVSLAKVNDIDFERQVTAPVWKLVNGRMKIEKKEETKKRLGQSPDMAVAFVYAFAPWEKGFEGIIWV